MYQRRFTCQRLLPRAFRYATLAIVLSAVGCAGSPSAPDPVTGLSSARDISGTWITAVAVPFIHQSDFCGRGFESVGRSLWNVTWTVTAVSGFSNVVDVEMRYSRGSTTASGGCGGDSGWVPPISPSFFRLCISSSQITGCSGETYRNGQAFGPFTSNLMSLTWTRRDCIIYCSGEVTETNALKLTKRS